MTSTWSEELRANAAQNIGILCQQDGEAARDRGDEPAARWHFEAARATVQESLEIKRALDDKVGEAASLSQLAQIHVLLGDLDAAERHAHEARQIRESLELTDVYRDYGTLSEIAQARGDNSAAAEWARQRDEMLAERTRRAGGEGSGLPAEVKRVLQSLTLACARAAFGEDPLDAESADLLARLDESPAPCPDFAGCLRQLAAGQMPAIPSSLPAELRQMLDPIVDAIRSQRG